MSNNNIVSDYVAAVTSNPIQHAVTALAGAVAMRAADTRVIRDTLGRPALERFKAAAIGGRLPLINA